MAAPRILIVDDEAPLTQLLCHAFTGEQFQVATARDGIDCMNKVAVFRPEVIVMDIMMPKLDGVETTRLIRRNRSYAETIVIALSASSNAQAREDVLAAGADLFMRKPFVIARLVERVQQLLLARAHPR